MDNQKTEEKDKLKILVRTPYDYQRLKLEKLMKTPVSTQVGRCSHLVG